MINDFFVIVQVSNKYGDGDRYIENVILDCLGTVHRFYNGNDLLTFTNSKKANEHFIKLKEESEEFYENLIRESLVTLMFQYNKYKELNDIMGPKHDR